MKAHKFTNVVLKYIYSQKFYEFFSVSYLWKPASILVKYQSRHQRIFLGKRLFNHMEAYDITWLIGKPSKRKGGEKT